jgi:hypothetical protein
MGLYAAGWRKVWRVNRDGDAFRVWEPIKMGRVSEGILDCAIYLFESEGDAAKGGWGGSGFLVSVPFQIDDLEEALNDDGKGAQHVYAVTNAHVIDQGFRVIRLNSKEGATRSYPVRECDWFRHPDGDDLAITLLDVKNDAFRYRPVGLKAFITKERRDRMGIGIGDEALMIGRFLGRDETGSNAPLARFGNLAGSQIEFVDQGKERSCFRQESFLVECHSICGFSGSPVFVGVPQFRIDRNKLLDFLERKPNSPATLAITASDAISYFLLGIDWGHLDEANFPGMAGVVPAWRLLDMLSRPEVAQMRKEREREIEKRPHGKLDLRSPGSQQTLAPREKERIAIPIPTKRQFEKDLRKATRRR